MLGKIWEGMHSPSRPHGQGALETILLLGGAVLITVIILSMLFSSVTIPGTTINANIAGYTQHVVVSGGFNNPPPGPDDPDDPIEPPPACGDNTIDPGETCDPPTPACVPGYDSSCEYCNDSCQTTTLQGGYCGDAIIEGPESCDEGDNVDGDGCSSSCEDEADPLSYMFDAKFEPPLGKILHGMGQWDHPGTGNPKYVNLLTNTSENPLASPNLHPASKLTFVGIADDAARWDPFILNLPASLTAQSDAGMIPHLDISLRGNKPLVIDPLDPLYGVDDEIAHSTAWDARIQQLADAYASYGKPAFIRIGGEFSGNWNGYHPYDYPIAYRKIVQMFKDAGADNVAFIWCYEPAAPGDFMEQDALGNYKWFPGNDVIDWYGLDIFGPADFTPGGFNYAHSIAFVNASVAANKPLHLSETSVAYLDLTPSEADGMSDWSEWFVSFFAFMESHPNIKAFHYINYDWQLAGDYQLNGWKNADITVNDYISQKYLEELSNEKYLHSPEVSTLNGYGDYPG